jgi:hypothetical protein
MNYFQFFKKYLKYKKKYLELKKQYVIQKGGSNIYTSNKLIKETNTKYENLIDSQIINKYLNSKKYDFKLFNINYNKKEQECIDNIKINTNNNYNYYGSINTMTNINTFLLKIGDNNKEEIDKLEQIILKLIKNVLDGYQQKYFWLLIRVTTPSNVFNIPRWHKDGSYFGNNISTSKFVAVLKGPGTLFIKSSTQVSNIYNKLEDEIMKELNETEQNKIEQNKIEEKYRYIYADKLQNEKIIQTNNNQGAIFFAKSGDIDGAIHSEPNIDNYRIFISIIPNTKKNIKKLKKKLNK